MPEYTYICDNCNYEFDKIQRMIAKALKKCPKCKQNTLHRHIYTPHVHVVGDCLGITAEKNARNMSNDFKEEKAAEYKTKKEKVLKQK